MQEGTNNIGVTARGHSISKESTRGSKIKGNELVHMYRHGLKEGNNMQNFANRSSGTCTFAMPMMYVKTIFVW